MSYFWSRIRAIPAGVWFALAAALAVLSLFLRGRRLEGELAHAKVVAEVSAARVEVAVSKGQADVHVQRAIEKHLHVQRLEAVRAQVREKVTEEHRRLAALSPKDLDDAYLRLAQEKKPVL